MAHTKCRECSATDPGPRKSWARGLCARCYSRHQKRGTLDQFERLIRPRDYVLEDWLFLNEQGYNRAQAAERMGMTRGALDRAIARARRDGDPRPLQERKVA